MKPKLDGKDVQILSLLQKNCKLTVKEIARKVGSPITTVFAKIKRMEQLGIIKEYRAVLDHKKLRRGATAFILASFSYETQNQSSLSQREIAKQIARFPEVQEVHIIAGDWDILVKVKEKDIAAIGKFVIDKLRTIKGIEKTLTCMVFETQKETTEIPVQNLFLNKE
ncbi:MAG TPA: Lrp/AsnC family transcriptional regulator [Candidatus Bathyarchaeota archaeon]|nr:MAG: Lrp/AsnC family transcriptional regulator [Candidatus Bathyarchaeota archaeon]HDI07431.1 Lrp/AsnC family transcriptional regulator [Candidatus Bathyarchaeota archaeon]